MLNSKLYIFSTLLNFSLINKFTKNDLLLAIRKNSLIHCCISGLFGILYLLNLISTETQGIIVNYSAGYVINDLYLYTWKKELSSEKYETYLHHALFFLGVLNYDKYPNLYSNLILTEISTIPLNLRYIYKNNKNLKTYFSLTFYVLFFILRIININHILLNMLLTDEFSNYIIFSMFIFSSLNGYWFFLMTKKLIGFIKKK